MDAKNANLARSYTVLCLACVAEKISPGEELKFGGGLVGGQRIEGFEESLRAALRAAQLHGGRN